MLMEVALRCRHLVRDSSADQGELARFLQAIAREGAAGASPSEASSLSSGTSHSTARDAQHCSAGPSGAATELDHRQDPQATTDLAQAEVLQHVGCCGLPDSIGAAPWQELCDTTQPSSAETAGSPVLSGLQENSASFTDSQQPECSTSRAAEPPGCNSWKIGLSQVKQEQVKQLCSHALMPGCHELFCPIFSSLKKSYHVVCSRVTCE